MRISTDWMKVLYINLGCPWASRSNLVRTLKGLEEIIQMVVLDWELFPEGWSVPFPPPHLKPQYQAPPNFLQVLYRS